MAGGEHHAIELRNATDLRDQEKTRMAKIIVSYDDTDNDRDALALGSTLSELDGEISLAYVRHTQQPDSAREALEEREAKELLKNGADALGDEKIEQHVVVHASTGTGLWELAESEKADLIVFGSDYRTAKGAVLPGTSAQRMLTGGPAAVAIAPAGYRNENHEIKTVGVLPEDDGDDAAFQTAKDLADAIGGTVADRHEGTDLLVLGSSPASPKGHVNLSARAGYAIETANTPVIAVPRGTAVKFAKPGFVKRVAAKV
jgi:nucleotide-binding universal stress UspA family protein